MKKKNLSLSSLKVNSFITQSQGTQMRGGNTLIGRCTFNCTVAPCVPPATNDCNTNTCPDPGTNPPVCNDTNPLACPTPSNAPGCSDFLKCG